MTTPSARDDITIRQVRADDLDRIADLEAICFPSSEAASRTSFAARIAAFPDCFLVAQEEQIVIGYVDGCLTDSETIRDEFFHDASHHNPHGRNLCVFGLAVAPESRGLGIGVLLLNHFIDLAKRTGRQGVILTCKAQLLEYYQKFRFINLGTSNSNHGGAQWFDMILRLNRNP